MSLTLFGIIWLVTIAVCFVNRRIKYLVALTLFSMVLQCDNVLLLGSKGVGPQIITSMAFILRSFFLHVPRNRISAYSLSFLFCSILILYLLFNIHILNIADSVLMTVLQIAIYAICFYRLYVVRKYLTVADFRQMALNIIIFIVIFSPIQYFATLGIIPRSLLTPFFFNDLSEFVYFHRPDTYKRILGTFMEPSFCSSFFVGAFFFVFHLRNIIPHSKIILSLLAVELILTTSSTGYGTFAIMIVLYLLLFMDRKTTKMMLPVFLLLVIFFFTTKDTLLKDVIFDKMETGSGIHRQSLNNNAMYNFQMHSLLGVGYQQSRASSLVLTLLAELGVVGFIIYFLFFLSLILPLIFHKNGAVREYEMACRLFVLSITIAQIVAIPDIQLSTYWFSLYLLALARDKYESNVYLKVTCK